MNAVRAVLMYLPLTGWLLAAWLPAAFASIALMAAGCATVCIAIRSSARPAVELYLAGKAQGRAEALAEERSGVTRLDRRRTLRAVE